MKSVPLRNPLTALITSIFPTTRVTQQHEKKNNTQPHSNRNLQTSPFPVKTVFSQLSLSLLSQNVQLQMQTFRRSVCSWNTAASISSLQIAILDLFLAFNRRNHQILLSIRKTALYWHSQILRGLLRKKVNTGVPQGSVLGLLLLSIYTTPAAAM